MIITLIKVLCRRDVPLGRLYDLDHTKDSQYIFSIIQIDDLGAMSVTLAQDH